MALNFTSSFVTFAGDTSTVSNFSRSVSVRRHRSRRQRKQRRNVIGFSVYVGHSEDSSGEDEDGMDIPAPELSFSVAPSISYAEEGFQDQIGKMSTELDGLVRFLRRGVESLAGATGEAVPAFGVLAFALEDWDY
jgi:gamma-tubulin complex component 5